jgi:YVTN family beta-propeller protein
MKRSILLMSAGILLVLGLLIHFPGQKLAREHVNSKTAVNDHPLLCISCHLYTSKNKVISGFINADYYSPFNLAVSSDGSRLYVVAQDADELMVVDAGNNKVLNRIRVGNYPHSVVLDSDNKRAYVSNEWADNVSVVDLAKNEVVDTLITGNGPAGMTLSADGRYLYVVNSYSSDISVVDLGSGEEKKRFTAGNNPTGIGLSPDGNTICVPSRRVLIAPYGDTLKTELTVIDGSRQRVSYRKNIESAYLMETWPLLLPVTWLSSQCSGQKTMYHQYRWNRDS